MYPYNCKLFSTTRPFCWVWWSFYTHHMLEFTNPYCDKIVLYHLLSTLVYGLLRFTNLQLTRFTFCPFWLFATNTQRIIFHHISLLLYELYTTPKWFISGVADLVAELSSLPPFCSLPTCTRSSDISPYVRNI